mgnify:CR=1 FL=1
MHEKEYHERQHQHETDYPQEAQEQSLRKKVTLDLEIEPSKTKTHNNPYQKLIHLAEAVDAWRLFPRVFISVYMFLLIHVVIWFTNLENPSMEQSGLISVVVGAGAAWFGLYTGTGNGKSVKFTQRK